MLFNKNWDKVPNDPVSDVLLKAADLLEKHGLAKSTRIAFDGSMCFLGALEKAQGYQNTWSDTPLTYAASEAVSKALGLPEPFPGDYRHAVVRWNNASERTVQEVVAAMRLAAKTKVTA